MHHLCCKGPILSIESLHLPKGLSRFLVMLGDWINNDDSIILCGAKPRQAEFSYSHVGSHTQSYVILQCHRDNLWLHKDPSGSQSQECEYFRGNLSLDPTDVVCPRVSSDSTPFLCDLAKSGEIIIDHKVDIESLLFLPNYPISSLDFDPTPLELSAICVV